MGFNKKFFQTGGIVASSPAAAAGLDPLQNFETVTYTGNGGTQKITGYIRKGAAFSNGYITTPFDRQNIVNLNDKTEDFCISLWVNLAAYGSSNVIFSINSGAPSYQYIGLVTTSTGVNWVHYPGGAAGNAVVSSVNLNEWNHFACVRENSTMKLYKNGSLVGSDPITYANTTFGTGERIVIGKRTSVGDLPLNGKVDQVRIFNKALSSSELTTLYGETYASSTKSTTDIFGDGSGVALYELDEDANDTGGVSGKFGSAAIFNGSSSKITSSPTLGNQGTFSFWVNFNNLNNQSIFATGIGTNTTVRAIIFNSNLFFQYGSSGDAILFSTSLLTTGTWHHIVGTYTTTALEIFLDGSSITSNTFSTKSFSFGNFTLGNDPQDTSLWLNGKIDDVRIYSDVLTSTEVGYIYNNTTASIPTDNLVAYYKLDGDATDETGTYDGTATNVSWGYDGTATNVNFLGMAFQPDLVWIKPRSFADNHVLSDSVRGVNKSLASNSTAAENSLGVTSFDSNGFSLPSWGNVTSNGNTFVAWCWKAADTTTTISAGTVGNTIASDVRANTAAGFSIVTYEGNLTDGATVGHGLNDAPEMIIVKGRDTTYGWVVYHADLGNTKYLVLNITNGEAIGETAWNNTSPTSNVFTIGSGVAVNENSMIAYCFHSVDGYQKIGSYSGGSTGSGNVITTGFKPRFLLVKRTDSAGDAWQMFDSIRGGGDTFYNYLQANEAYAEASYALREVNFTTNGFYWTNAESGTNISGGTYIYLAIA